MKKEIMSTVNSVEIMLDKVVKDMQDPVKKVIEFIKNHKKVIFTIGVIYFIYNYLFKEE